MPGSVGAGAPLQPQQFFSPTVEFAVSTQLVTPANASLVLTTFAPTVSTPVVVTPAKTTLVLATFAPTVATPQLVTPGKLSLLLTPFAPAVTIGTQATTPTLLLLGVGG